MQEVEILVQVNEPKQTVLDKLNNFTFKGQNETIDIYYYEPLRKNLQVINDEYPTEWFRIRNKNNQAFITYKKDNYNGKTWVYSDEHETEVTDFETCKEIIHKLGFKELVTIDNIKHTFETELYEIVLEEVKELGLFLEVERLNVNDNESIDKIKTEIQTFIDNLGINVSKELNMGKPELMLKKIKG